MEWGFIEIVLIIVAVLLVIIVILLGIITFILNLSYSETIGKYVEHSKHQKQNLNAIEHRLGDMQFWIERVYTEVEAIKKYGVNQINND